MDRLMPFDELNVLRTIVTDICAGSADKRRFEGYLFDLIEEILLMSYIFGNEAANTMLDTEIPVDDEAASKSVNRRVAGKTWRQRVEEYMGSEVSTVEDIMRVAETDSHRIYNEAIWDVAEAEQKEGVILYKRWETMLDDRVRDTHQYLEGETIPLDEFFVTYDGDFALRPGDFSDPANNINCRCRLRLIRG